MEDAPSPFLSSTAAPPEVDAWLQNNLGAFSFAFTVSDPQSRDNPIVYASQMFYDMTGYSPNEVLGKNCRFLQGPGTERQKVMEIRDAVREERAAQVCITNYRKNGERFMNQFYMCPIRNDVGHLIHYVGIQTDVTAAVREQARLAQATRKAMGASPQGSSELLNWVSDSVDEVVAVEAAEAAELSHVLSCGAGNSSSQLESDESSGLSSDSSSTVPQLPCSLKGALLDIQQSFVLADPNLPDMPIVHVSDRFLELTGYPRCAVVGRNCRFLQAPGCDPAEVQKLREAIHSNPPQPVTVTLLNRRASGELFWNALHVAPIRSADGSVMFFVGVQLNVTQASLPAAEQPKPSCTGLSTKMAHKGVTGAVRVAVRSLGGETGLRRSLDCHGLPRSTSGASCNSSSSLAGPAGSGAFGTSSSSSLARPAGSGTFGSAVSGALGAVSGAPRSLSGPVGLAAGHKGGGLSSAISPLPSSHARDALAATGYGVLSSSGGGALDSACSAGSGGGAGATSSGISSSGNVFVSGSLGMPHPSIPEEVGMGEESF